MEFGVLDRSQRNIHQTQHGAHRSQRNFKEYKEISVCKKRMED